MGYNALILASSNGHYQVVQCLVETGRINVNAPDSVGLTAMYVASQDGHLAVVQCLVEKGQADINFAHTLHGQTSLHVASRMDHLNVVKYLVGTGRAKVDAVNHRGRTALYLASENGHLSVVKFLVATGQADVEAVANDGRTALIIAKTNGHEGVVAYLQQHTSVDISMVDINIVTADTRTLIMAAQCNNLAELRKFVETQKINVNATDSAGWTALHHASFQGHLASVRYLLTKGRAVVDIVNNAGETALFAASKRNRLAVVQYLVETGRANVTVVAKSNQTALDVASVKGFHDIVAYLQLRQSTTEVPLSPTSFVAKPIDPSPLAPVAAQPLPPPTPSPPPPPTPSPTLTSEQHQMKAAIDGTGKTFAVSEAYVQSISTERILGRGFFGTVFHAIDRDLDRSFAVKAVNAEILAGGTLEEIQRTKKSFEKEQQTLSHFRHPNMAKLYAYSFPTEVRGNYFLVYEIAEKGSLDSFWRKELKRLRLSFRRRVQIALDIMTAVRFLHVGNADRSIASCFHRDIKSSNIVLKQDLTAQLIDCGLAKFVVDGSAALAASSGLPKGTPGYICPEYASGQVKVYDCACDIYSLGVVLVELWIGNVQNYEHSSSRCFNFTDQYIKLKKGKTKRDLLLDADPSFGLAPDDSFPDYMVRFVELAKECMGDHEDIPDGKHVMAELLAIRQACEADEDGTALTSETPSPSTELQLCDRCQSFPKMPNDEICRMCSGEEHRRLEMETLRSLLLDMGSVLGNLDARFTNMVPRLFYIVPAEKKNAFSHPREYLKSKASTKYYLYFICAHSKALVDAPLKIRLSKEWVTAAAPVLAVSLKVLQLGLSATGLPLNLDGFVHQVTTAGVDQMLSEVASIMANVGSHGDLLRRLEEHRPLSDSDVPELEGEAYKLVVEKATEQSAWRNLMEPVRAANSSATMWVTKDIANNSSLGYVKARPGY